MEKSKSVKNPSVKKEKSLNASKAVEAPGLFLFTELSKDAASKNKSKIFKLDKITTGGRSTSNQRPRRSDNTRSACSFTSENKLLDDDSKYDHRGIFAGYVRQFHANKTGFLILCLFSILIITAILFVALASFKARKMEQYHKLTTISRTAKPKIQPKSADSRIEKALERYDELNKICRSRLGPCWRHDGFDRTSCTHLNCSSVMFNVTHDPHVNKLKLFRVPRTVLAAPAKDKQRCVVEVSRSMKKVGRCLHGKCVVSVSNSGAAELDDMLVKGLGIDPLLNNADIAKFDEAQNRDCINFIIGVSQTELLPWKMYDECHISDRNRSCTSDNYSVKLKLHHFGKYFRPKAYNYKGIMVPLVIETLPIQLVKCRNVCQESREIGRLVCDRESGCEDAISQSMADFSPCCLLDLHTLSFESGRCVAGLCFHVSAFE